jgi:hypothetical protein
MQHPLDFLAAQPGGVPLEKIPGFFDFVFEMRFYPADAHDVYLQKIEQGNASKKRTPLYSWFYQTAREMAEITPAIRDQPK